MTTMTTTKDETSPLTASTKVLSRTYEATTLREGGGGSSQRRGSFRSNNENDSQQQQASPTSFQTTDRETIIHLLKGYLGPGCLSLPYAVSQLGITGGILGIIAMSYWTSVNCKTVVNIKRHMEKTMPPPPQPRNSHINAENEDAMSESSSNITYPDVGEWAYGAMFQAYVSACIISLQMAVCTVYVSFIGENLLAVAHFVGMGWMTHTVVMTMALPFILMLSFLPSLKVLAPVMAVATILLIITLASLGIIVVDEWPNHPDETPTITWSQVPMGLCMILYSYEGINLILPVHAAMQNPDHFDFVFWFSMALVALCLALVAVVSVLTFGNVTNGSLTAFLLEAHQDDQGADNITAWIMFANTTVSLSVLLTYPLTMFPAIELMGPIMQRNTCCRRLFGALTGGGNKDNDADEEEDPLEAFEPLPPIKEHGAVQLDFAAEQQQHTYGVDGQGNSLRLARQNSAKGADGDASDAVSVLSFMAGQAFWNVEFTLPGDSVQLRAMLVLLTYLIAVSIPNVQALISLVGALAGSSAALLIPPVLELAWIEHVEHLDEATKSPFGASPAPPSPHLLRKQNLRKKKRRNWWDGGKYWKTKIKCYLSFTLGVVFLAIGTGFSVMDIISLYRDKA